MALTLALGQQSRTSDGGAGLVIRSTTALVQVRVAAEDSKGRPVTDLQKDDFAVLDDRKPQSIAMFVADRGEQLGPAANAATAKTSGGSGAGTGYALLVLDWLNTPYDHRVLAQAQVVKLLRTFHPGQKVAVYLVGHEPALLSNFTDDMDILAQVVMDASPGFVDLAQPLPANRQTQIFDSEKTVKESFSALERIAESLARRPGRKSLIWLSEGFPLGVGITSYRQHFEQFVNRLNRADVGVYTIDARGLSTSRAQTGNLDLLKEVAERTGGTAFYERNDLDEGIRLAFEDQRLGYTLAYRLPDQATQGMHEIRVQVKREGVKLRYRESYELVESVR